ncbi:MAG: glycosyltransferase [Acidobacteriota bacterium]|nr:glycosyltransferase [Acidobacteriota bacterium]
MQGLFWLSASVIGYTYAGYPLLIWACSKVRPQPWQRRVQVRPVSVVMAVHNGAHLLRGQIEHLAGLDPAYVREIIIVSDGSADETPAILSEIADKRFKAIVLTEQVGKATALNHGISAATGEILLFVDIRPKITEGALARLMSNFADPAVGCVAGELLLSQAGHDGAASAVSGVYWRYEQWIRNCEAAFDSPVGVYGGFYAARRALVRPYPEGIILDDMFQPLSIVRQGYRSVLDREAVVLDRWPEKVSGEFQRKIRTLAGNYQLVARAPWMLGLYNRLWWQLVSHKLLRLVVPYCFLATLLSATVLGMHSMGWALLALAQWCFWVLAAVGLKVRLPLVGKLAGGAGALLVLNLAAVAGLYKFLFTRGPLWKIWSATNQSTQAGHDATTRLGMERGRA